MVRASTPRSTKADAIDVLAVQPRAQASRIERKGLRRKEGQQRSWSTYQQDIHRAHANPPRGNSRSTGLCAVLAANFPPHATHGVADALDAARTLPEPYTYSCMSFIIAITRSPYV